MQVWHPKPHLSNGPCLSHHCSLAQPFTPPLLSWCLGPFLALAVPLMVWSFYTIFVDSPDWSLLPLSRRKWNFRRSGYQGLTVPSVSSFSFCQPVLAWMEPGSWLLTRTVRFGFTLPPSGTAPWAWSPTHIVIFSTLHPSRWVTKGRSVIMGMGQILPSWGKGHISAYNLRYCLSLNPLALSAPFIPFL